MHSFKQKLNSRIAALEDENLVMRDELVKERSIKTTMARQYKSVEKSFQDKQHELLQQKQEFDKFVQESELIRDSELKKMDGII